MTAQKSFNPFEKSETSIYFGLPDDAYHSVEALSNSGIKELLVDPLDFWYQSWMNPHRTEKESSAMLFGKAFHKFVLEGEEEFDNTFVADPLKADHPEALDTVEDMQSWLRDHELKISGKKAELRDRIKHHDSSVVFWDNLRLELMGERSVLKQDDIDQIKNRCRIVRAIPSIYNIVKDGCAEVSIFWTEQSDHGPVRLKARTDKLKPNGTIADLKTFQNSQRRKLEDAVSWEIATRKYNLQAAIYRRAVKSVIDAYKAKKLIVVGAPDGFLDELSKAEHIRFALIFVQNHDAPNAIARELREFETLKGLGMSPNAYWRNAEEAWKYAVQKFGRFHKHYGNEPWVEEKAIKALTDHDLPMFVQDGMI
ncbi:PD-(D/E)XK nuclease-like domain-containing protein [Terasakiella sp.]|uniref:PD-(D/E)XK nuclease-like domain-containing protein n=1 Tax=Terasakiella sp. TaxID=2034861 RepID=UPI003AA96B9C